MRRFVAVLTALAGLVAACAGAPAPRGAGRTPLQVWLSHTPVYVAHRGGDADWPAGTAYAYAQAAAWNPDLALEVPVWRTADGVWVVSESPVTGPVFGRSYAIRTTRWATLATLRSRVGGHPMARLVNDVLDVYGRSRILFVDDKSGGHAAEFLDVLGSYAGPSRYVIKCYWQARKVPELARHRGYLVWGYYYARDMPRFAATQTKFDLLGLEYTAPAADFAVMRATGKPVIAHLIADPAAARTALADGARGLMVSGVRAVVPLRPAPTGASSGANSTPRR